MGDVTALLRCGCCSSFCLSRVSTFASSTIRTVVRRVMRTLTLPATRKRRRLWDETRHWCVSCHNYRNAFGGMCCHSGYYAPPNNIGTQNIVSKYPPAPNFPLGCSKYSLWAKFCSLQHSGTPLVILFCVGFWVVGIDGTRKNYRKAVKFMDCDTCQQSDKQKILSRWKVANDCLLLLADFVHTFSYVVEIGT